ncbi:MAG: hypothetical protein M0R17_03315 [Candidatus Omnitrophica bacterium]|jgi:nitrogen regulatory protein PII-like uncharacterized protein|nr:hypothetical protein [Candidatus Omnitrophota bacterium]
MNLRADKKIVHIGIALDESGSMASSRRETVSGLNEHIQEYKKFSDIETTLTLVKFSSRDNISTVFNATPINNIVDFTDKDYNPNGTTAMYDGVAKLLNEMKNSIIDNDFTTYVILIISDGAENCSVEYNSKQISEMISERLDTKRWTINYIGANQDLSVVKYTLNLAGGSSLKYSSDSTGTTDMWNNVNTASVRYMSTRSTTSNDDIKLESFSKGLFTN